MGPLGQNCVPRPRAYMELHLQVPGALQVHHVTPELSTTPSTTTLPPAAFPVLTVTAFSTQVTQVRNLGYSGHFPNHPLAINQGHLPTPPPAAALDQWVLSSPRAPTTTSSGLCAGSPV